MVSIGNDIVDLSEEANSNKKDDKRFCTRIFNPEEQEMILASENPNLALWSIWAVKEAAYKALKRLEPHQVFRYKKFQVDLKKDFVSFEHHEMSLRLKTTREFVHAIVFLQQKKGDGPEAFRSKEITGKSTKIWIDRVDHLRKNTNASQTYKTKWPEEKRGRNQLSFLVRHQVRSELSKLLGIDVSEIQIKKQTYEGRPTYPYLILKGLRSELLLSLSHHGKFVASAVMGV